MRLPYGYYWVAFPDEQWQIAEWGYDGCDCWRIIGSGKNYTTEDFDVIDTTLRIIHNPFVVSP